VYRLFREKPQVKTIAFILLLTAVPCVAQSPTKYSSTVQLVISCEDESLKDQFNSFLSRELRALGDITVVDTRPAIIINLIVVKLSTVKLGSGAFSLLKGGREGMLMRLPMRFW